VNSEIHISHPFVAAGGHGATSFEVMACKSVRFSMCSAVSFSNECHYPV